MMIAVRPSTAIAPMISHGFFIASFSERLNGVYSALRQKHKTTKTPRGLCNGLPVSLIQRENQRRIQMSIDKNKIRTQDELDEAAPMDQAEERARAEMKELERQAKKDVAEGLRQTDADE
jgi:hypothetical protein